MFASKMAGAYYLLRLKVSNELYDMYKETSFKHNLSVEQGQADAGFDLFCPEDLPVAGLTTTKINQGVKGAMEFFSEGSVKGTSVGYYMYPRSSTGTKTPLRLANSVGIIDAGYRGNYIAVFDNWRGEVFQVEKLQRLVQICPPNLTYPMRVELVEDLGEPTLRGEGGFGSTGK
jgi:dUTP pyrophosphatase